MKVYVDVPILNNTMKDLKSLHHTNTILCNCRSIMNVYAPHCVVCMELCLLQLSALILLLQNTSFRILLIIVYTDRRGWMGASGEIGWRSDVS